MRQFTIFVSLLVLASPVAAESLQRTLSSRWRGAWVVTQVEIYSACNGFFTNNRVNNGLVHGEGQPRFSMGELAQVKEVDLKRSRIDLFLKIREPILVPHQDGPFTLYTEQTCKAEAMIDLPRDTVEEHRVESIDRIIKASLERHSSQDAGRRSELWNRRERGPYPEDYEKVLADHAAWRVNEFNAAVDVTYEAAVVEAGRITDRLHDDPDYLSGFAYGVERARDQSWGACGKLVERGFALVRCEAYDDHDADNPEHRRWRNGYADGQRLSHSLALIRLLPGCYLPLPVAAQSSSSPPPNAERPASN